MIVQFQAAQKAASCGPGFVKAGVISGFCELHLGWRTVSDW